MKKCPYCGKDYPDEATVCEIDQQTLVHDGPLPAQTTPATPSAKQTVATPSARAVKPALMTQLRSVHLYLGCIFAPMLLLFAITGIWQTAGIQGPKWMAMLSNIHTSHKLKAGGPTLTGPLLRCFILLMATAFVVTTILGIIMAVNYGRNRRTAYYSLAFGVAFPLLLILIQRVL